MTTSHEQAEAHVEELTTKRESWAQKQAQLVSARADLQRNAGAAALEGTPTAKIADQLSRITSEIDIAGQALAAIDAQIAAAEIETRVARILDQRAKVAAMLQEAYASEEAIKPHLDAIEKLTGLRYGHMQSRAVSLIQNATRYFHHCGDLEYKLPEDVRSRLLAEREVNPTDADRVIHRWQYPHAVEQLAA